MTEARRFVVDASNLRTGGALQVASAVLTEMWALSESPQSLNRWPFLSELEYLVSREVAENLPPRTDLGSRLGGNVQVTAHSVTDMMRRNRMEYDVSFTIFGPEYVRGLARKRLVGCADGLVLLPTPRGIRPPGPVTRMKRGIKGALWRVQLRSIDTVVETDRLARRLIDLGAAPHKVHVVPNCPHPGFWYPVPEPMPGLDRQGVDEILLCYPARGHPHKNHAFLVALHDELRRRGRSVRFVVTLTDDEMAALPAASGRALISTGPLRVEDLPALYAACDGVVFPSLLETFSVTPLEALASRTPLFAADRAFVREVVGEAAGYFNPLDAVAAAEAFASWWDNEAARKERVIRGEALVEGLPKARDRAASYLDLMARLGAVA